MNPKIQAFFDKDSKWKKEYAALRSIVLECELEEDYKWMHPCYTLGGNNVVLIHGFKEYCALLFHKGSLMKDPEGILIQQTENVQVPRQIRVKNLQEIIDQRDAIRAYVFEAIAVEKSGVQATLKKIEEFNMPEEFQQKLEELPELKTAFEALTPGRQRGYLLHFSQPKQSKTRVARIEKCMEMIFEGKGLNDGFRGK